MIGAGQPQRGIALHAMIARGHVLQHRVQRVAHVQLTGYVWRRHHYRKRLLALNAMGDEVAVFLPFAVEFILHLLGIPGLGHFSCLGFEYLSHYTYSSLIDIRPLCSQHAEHYQRAQHRKQQSYRLYHNVHIARALAPAEYARQRPRKKTPAPRPPPA